MHKVEVVCIKYKLGQVQLRTIDALALNSELNNWQVQEEETKQYILCFLQCKKDLIPGNLQTNGKEWGRMKGKDARR